jgi:hypothetical protein
MDLMIVLKVPFRLVEPDRPQAVRRAVDRDVQLPGRDGGLGRAHERGPDAPRAGARAAPPISACNSKDVETNSPQRTPLTSLNLSSSLLIGILHSSLALHGGHPCLAGNHLDGGSGWYGEQPCHEAAEEPADPAADRGPD